MDHREFQTPLCATNKRLTMWKPLCKIEGKKLESGLLVHIPFHTSCVVVTRQEISAHCLKWSKRRKKKCKEAFTSPIMAVIILHICKCSCYRLLLLTSESRAALQYVQLTQTYTGTCSFRPCCCWLNYLKSWNICFISSVFHRVFLNESAPLNLGRSFSSTWQVEHFVQRS